MKAFWAGIFFLGFLAASAPGDTVYFRDGTVREGLVEAHDDQTLTLLAVKDGITGVMVIPMAEIARVVINPRTRADLALLKQENAKRGPVDLSSPPESDPVDLGKPAPASSPAPPAPKETAPAFSDAELKAFRSRGFFGEMIESLRGNGADQVQRLPAAVRALWKQAASADKGTAPAETLELLRKMEFLMRSLPGGMERLAAISNNVRGEPFGLWMARIHWQIVSEHFSSGQFDFSDVRDIERPYLVGLLKEQTRQALEPLKGYFPPVDPATGQKDPFRPSQLAGITTTNALEVKDKAAYAAAVLLAQLKLEPEMSGVDRGFVSGQLADVNHVLARARELEPLAKMAAARAEQEKKAAAEKARRDAAIARAQAATRAH